MALTTVFLSDDCSPNSNCPTLTKPSVPESQRTSGKVYLEVRGRELRAMKNLGHALIGQTILGGGHTRP